MYQRGKTDQGHHGNNPVMTSSEKQLDQKNKVNKAVETEKFGTWMMVQRNNRKYAPKQRVEVNKSVSS